METEQEGISLWVEGVRIFWVLKRQGCKYNPGYYCICFQLHLKLCVFICDMILICFVNLRSCDLNHFTCGVSRSNAAGVCLTVFICVHTANELILPCSETAISYLKMSK